MVRVLLFRVRPSWYFECLSSISLDVFDVVDIVGLLELLRIAGLPITHVGLLSAAIKCQHKTFNSPDNIDDEIFMHLLLQSSLAR